MGKLAVRLAAASLALVAVATDVVKAQDEQPARLNVRIEDEVRRRLEQDPGEFFLNGTGFFVSDGLLIVTSAHVVGGCRYFDVIDRAANTSRATLLVWDGRRDVAVLRPHTPNRAGGLRLRRPILDRQGREREPPLLDNPTAWVMHFGEGALTAAQPEALGAAQRLMVRAYPSAHDEYGQLRDEAYEVLLFPGRLEPGTSGGPVLNDRDEVVALVTALATGEVLGTPIRDIARVMQAAGYTPFPEGPARPIGDPADYVVKLRCR